MRHGELLAPDGTIYMTLECHDISYLHPAKVRQFSLSQNHELLAMNAPSDAFSPMLTIYDYEIVGDSRCLKHRDTEVKAESQTCCLSRSAENMYR